MAGRVSSIVVLIARNWVNADSAGLVWRPTCLIKKRAFREPSRVNVG